MQIRLASPLQKDSILDGEGIRSIIWTQGCIHHCPFCQNQETWDFDAGLLVDIEEVKRQIDDLVDQDGITFSGGDPMCQPQPCSILASYIKSQGLNVWCYTGFTYEQLILMSQTNKYILDFLNNIDVLVDGKFMIEFKSLDLLFRGSSNQRIIDVPKSLKAGKAVTIDKYMEKLNRGIKKSKASNIYI